MKVNMIKIALGALLLCAAPATFAQTDATTGATSQAYNQKKQLSPDKIAKRQTAQLAKQLGLTKAQQVKVDAINKKYAAQKRSKELIAKRKAEIESVLTADQKAKFANIKNKQAKIGKRK